MYAYEITQAPDPYQHVADYLLDIVGQVSAVLNRPAPTIWWHHSYGGAYSDGWRVCVDPEWVLSIVEAACCNGECCDGGCEVSVATGLLAHEFAHHLYGDVFNQELHPHVKELRADFIAGRVMAALGVEGYSFACVISALSAVQTPTHPLWTWRVTAINNGYQKQLDIQKVAEWRRILAELAITSRPMRAAYNRGQFDAINRYFGQ